MTVDRELRNRSLLITLTHDRLKIRPHGVRAFGEDPVPLIENLVEDLDTLIRQADLVGVGIHQRPPNGVP